MYWFSVTALGVALYFFCKGREKEAKEKEQEKTLANSEEVTGEEASEVDSVESIAVEVAESDETEETEDEGEDSKDEGEKKASEDSEKKTATESDTSAFEFIDKDTEEPENAVEDSVETADDESYEEIEISEIDDPSLIEEMLKSETDPLTRHYLYVKGVDLAYKERLVNPEMLTLAVKTAKSYVNEFAELKEAAFEALGDGRKRINVFKQLAIMLEEENSFDDAVDICETAILYDLDDGTKTGFQGRIDRLNRKKSN